MEFLLIGSIVFVLGIIFSGIYFIYKGIPADKTKMRRLIRLNMLFFIPLFVFCIATFVPGVINAREVATAPNGLGFIAAGLSTGLASIGAGIAVSNVGSSAIGAVSEDPSILGKSMIFLGLAEGIAIYGLIISIMILGRL